MDLELVISLREDGVLASLELIATETAGSSQPPIRPIVRSHRSIGRIWRQGNPSECMHNACTCIKVSIEPDLMPMPSLQIRDLPEPLHRLLQRRARAHKRSLSQQALADLETQAGGDPRLRRQAALERIEQRWSHSPPLKWPQSPEDLIRADRER